MAKTMYALFCRETGQFAMNGSRAMLFPQSADATTHQAASAAFRMDVLPPPGGGSRTWDVVSVTIA